mmetsp:Transcript_29576/g.95528  ORF Transcript_29576/g.95528 Transcript_29576/m.95528 type:complete len:263 (+) Transcript_29576:1254-2042(+)
MASRYGPPWSSDASPTKLTRQALSCRHSTRGRTRLSWSCSWAKTVCEPSATGLETARSRLSWTATMSASVTVAAAYRWSMPCLTSRKMSPRSRQMRPPSVSGPWAAGPVCTSGAMWASSMLKRCSRAKRVQRAKGGDALSCRSEAGSSGSVTNCVALIESALPAAPPMELLLLPAPPALACCESMNCTRRWSRCGAHAPMARAASPRVSSPAARATCCSDGAGGGSSRGDGSSSHLLRADSSDTSSRYGSDEAHTGRLSAVS